MELVAPRYMTRFRCIGPACEDTCCDTWWVFVDKKHYDLLRERMTSPSERAQFNAGYRKVDDGDKQRYALIVFQTDAEQSCSFLDGGLCSLHSRFGEEILGDTCALYPRRMGRIDQVVELVGTPSCPEVARQVLLHDDAIDQVPADPILASRRWLTRQLDTKDAEPYKALLLPVRGILLEILQNRRFSLASRLFFIAFFADRSRRYLKAGMKQIDADELHELGQSLQVTENLLTIQRGARSALVDGPYGIRVVRAVLTLLSENLTPKRRSVIGEMEDFFFELGAPLPGDPRAILRAWNALPPLAPELTARLDAILERYVAHSFVASWYTERPTFVGYYHELLARVATLRFLIGGHARIKPPADVAAFDAIVIRVVYLMSRLLEHASEYDDAMMRAFDEEGLELSHALALIRI